MKELMKHKEAFELYYSQGKTRSYQRVAKVLKVTEKSVAMWGKAFNWQQRVLERDRDIAEKVAEKVVEEEVDMKVKIYSAIAKTLDKYTENLLQGKVCVETVKDLEVLGKLWKDLESLGGTGGTVEGQPEGVNADNDINFNVKVRVVKAGGDYEEEVR